jgi:acyl carrier protein
MHDKLRPIIASHIGHPDLEQLIDEPSTTLADLRINAFALIGLSMEIEDALAIMTGCPVCITDEETHAWSTVADVVECAKRKVREKAMDELVADSVEEV